MEVNLLVEGCEWTPRRACASASAAGVYPTAGNFLRSPFLGILISAPSPPSVIVKFSGSGTICICTPGSVGKAGHECSDGVPSSLKIVSTWLGSFCPWKSGSPCWSHSAKMQPKDQMSTAVP